MEDLVILRRKQAAIGRFGGTRNPFIRMEIPKGTFRVFIKVAELLDIKKGDAIMFAFSRKNECAYIFREDPEQDSYYLCGSDDQSCYRFSSKVLMNYFIDFFQIEDKKYALFEVSDKKNEKGMFAITLKKNII